MSKLKILTIVLVLLGLFLPAVQVSADLVNPEFNTKHCKPGEKEIVATYSSKEPFGPRTSDETKKYQNKPNYYELSSEDHSFGGKIKYCQTDSSINTKLIGAGIAGVVAMSILGLVWLRRRSVH